MTIDKQPANHHPQPFARITTAFAIVQFQLVLVVKLIVLVAHRPSYKEGVGNTTLDFWALSPSLSVCMPVCLFVSFSLSRQATMTMITN